MGDVVSEAAQIVGAKIRKLRNEQSASQMHLGEIAGVDYNTVGRIERGHEDVRLSTLVKLAGALDVAPSELIRDVKPEHVTSRSPRLTVKQFIDERERRDRSSPDPSEG